MQLRDVEFGGVATRARVRMSCDVLQRSFEFINEAQGDVRTTFSNAKIDGVVDVALRLFAKDYLAGRHFCERFFTPRRNTSK